MKSPPIARADGPYEPHRGIGATFFTAPSTGVRAPFDGHVRLSCRGHTAVLSFQHISHITRAPCSESSPTP